MMCQCMDYLLLLLLILQYSPADAGDINESRARKFISAKFGDVDRGGNKSEDSYVAVCVNHKKVTTECKCGDGQCFIGNTCVEKICLKECDKNKKIEGTERCTCDGLYCYPSETCTEQFCQAGQLAQVGERTTPLPGQLAQVGERTTPLPGQLAQVGNQTAPLPGQLAQVGKRTAPLPGQLAQVGNQTEPLPECSNQKYITTECACGNVKCGLGSMCVKKKKKIEGEKRCTCNGTICHPGETCGEGLCIADCAQNIIYEGKQGCSCNGVYCPTDDTCVGQLCVAACRHNEMITHACLCPDSSTTICHVGHTCLDGTQCKSGQLAPPVQQPANNIQITSPPGQLAPPVQQPANNIQITSPPGQLALQGQQSFSNIQITPLQDQKALLAIGSAISEQIPQLSECLNHQNVTTECTCGPVQCGLGSMCVEKTCLNECIRNKKNEGTEKCTCDGLICWPGDTCRERLCIPECEKNFIYRGIQGCVCDREYCTTNEICRDQSCVAVCYEYQKIYLGEAIYPKNETKTDNQGITETAEGCQKICQFLDQCVQFNWRKGVGCYTKSTKDTPVIKDTFVTGPKNCSGEDILECFEKQKTYTGEVIYNNNNPGDTQNHGVAVTAEECQKKCQALHVCVQFNWKKGGGCYLRTTKRKEEIRDTFVTGPKNC